MAKKRKKKAGTKRTAKKKTAKKSVKRSAGKKKAAKKKTTKKKATKRGAVKKAVKKVVARRAVKRAVARAVVAALGEEQSCVLLVAHNPGLTELANQLLPALGLDNLPTAGIVGIDPGPFKLRQLLVMAEAKSRQAWNHTASILAMLANTHRDPKKSRAARPADFHPHHRNEKPAATKTGINVLKQVFVDRRPGA